MRLFEGGTSGIFRFVVKFNIPRYLFIFTLPCMLSLFSAQPHMCDRTVIVSF